MHGIIEIIDEDDYQEIDDNFDASVIQNQKKKNNLFEDNCMKNLEFID